MKSLFTILFLSLLTFGAALGGSWYYFQQQEAPADSSDAVSVSVPEKDSAVQDIDPVVPAETMSSNDSLPAAIRPRAASVEELVRMGLSLNDREAKLREKEETVQKRELQQQLALADLMTERQSLEGLKAEASQAADRAEQLAAELEARRQEMQQDMDARKATEANVPSPEGDPSRTSNTKRLAQWIQGMESTKAAELVQEMANDGQMDDAVEILSYFEEREAAKLLSAMEDTTLVNELVIRFRDLKTTRTSPRK